MDKKEVRKKRDFEAENKAMDMRIIQKDGKHYLSMGVCELGETVKISRRKIFKMIDNNELESLKDGKYRLVIFEIDESKVSIDALNELIKINKETEHLRACEFNKKSIFESIIEELEIRKMKKEYAEKKI